ncbi:MAG: amidophosphoribosyltransferase [Clostridia bacterium]
MSSLREECGVFGVYSPIKKEVAPMVYYGLFALQHRGQESCGIVVCDNGLFRSYKDIGIVNDVFTKNTMDYLGQGNIALGHVRYGTSGTDNKADAQPMVVNHIKGNMALAHNGSLVNYKELKKEAELEGAIFYSTSDAGVMPYLITKERLVSENIEEAIQRVMPKLVGSFSLGIMTHNKLVAVRDKHGFRPLSYGQTDDGTYVIASETCALDSVGAHFIRDVNPGEIIVFDEHGVKSIQTDIGDTKKTICVFEYIYFARPDSVIDGCSVHKARLRAGSFLALEHPVQADIVIGVPDSGIDAAIGYARQSGIPYGIGFIKNKYIGRTFIAPSQEFRENRVRIKLNPISATVKGKRVVLIDDSIVRGTTSARIVKLLRDAGALEVHMRVSAPPFVNPCYYGTDIASRDKLIACNHTHEEIEKIIGVDSLGYLSINSAKQIANTGNDKNCGYCTGCFDNNYPTAIPEIQEDRD